jgi:hypothetical protein
VVDDVGALVKRGATVVVDEEGKLLLAAEALGFRAEPLTADRAGQDQDVEIQLGQYLAHQPAIGRDLDVVERQPLVGLTRRRAEAGGAAPAAEAAGDEMNQGIGGGAHGRGSDEGGRHCRRSR